MILLDTHVLVWMASEPKQLSRRAREAIREARERTGVAIATITLWELAAALAVRLRAAFPKDPADRLITSTAMIEGAPLVTADARIRQAKVVQTIW